MPILSDTALQSLANLFTNLAMKDDCTISRNATTDSNYGSTETPVVIATCKGMRKRPSGGSNGSLLQLYAERLGSLSIWQVSLPKDQDVQEGDIITMDGDDMKVEAILEQTWEVSREVIASEIK